VTDTFLNLLHSGAVNPHQMTDKDRRALLDLVKKSLNTGGGGAKFDAPSSSRESA
jgi:hypothetical protein